VEKREIKNIVYGEANIQNVQGNENQVYQMVGSSVEDMISSLKMKLNSISDQELREDVEARADQLDLESKKENPDRKKLMRIKEFFERHLGTLSSVASHGIQIAQILMGQQLLRHNNVHVNALLQ